MARVPDDVPRWKIAYWQFQYELTQQYILPFLRDHDALPASGRVLEVGAGEGGCLAAISDATGLPADGLELSASRTELAETLGRALAPGEFRVRVGDIADPASADVLSPPYGLVLLRDVIEHVEAPEAALANIHQLLAPGGSVLFTFPPYCSPYGAHQQILSRWELRLPWLQLLPGFSSLVERREPVDGKREEIRGLKRCSLTLGRFEDLIRCSLLRVTAGRHFLIRPAFRYRYGLPVVGASIAGKIPVVRELAVTGAWYLAERSSSWRAG